MIWREVWRSEPAERVLNPKGRALGLMPRIAWRPFPQWWFALGEQAAFQQSSAHPQWSTWLMLERELSP